MSNRKVPNEYDETEVLPEGLVPGRADALVDAAAEAQGSYREYVRSLDDVPVLVDVVREPPRVVIKDFRRGQRPDARETPREDAALLREEHARELERQYAEYVEICAGLVGAERAGPRTAPRPGSAQKKRAKRAKRSARSKA